MSKWLTGLAAMALASGAAFAQDTAPPTESQQGQMEDQMEMSKSVADMKADELEGRKIVTADGEEIGEVDRIGHQSDMPQERVAAVDVGGFLGVGAKTVAIPLSKLEMTADGNLKTSLTRDELESQPVLDEQNFTAEETETEDSAY